MYEQYFATTAHKIAMLTVQHLIAILIRLHAQRATLEDSTITCGYVRQILHCFRIKRVQELCPTGKEAIVFETPMIATKPQIPLAAAS